MILMIVIEQGFQVDRPRPLPEKSDSGLDSVPTHPIPPSTHHPTVSIPPSTQYPVSSHPTVSKAPHPVPSTPPIRQFLIKSDFKPLQYQLCPRDIRFPSRVKSDFKPSQYQICPVETCGVPGVNPDLSIWLSLLQVFKMNTIIMIIGNINFT